MRREVSLEEISDGRLYELNDMVKADCQDCKGCFDCCTGMGDSVVSHGCVPPVYESGKNTAGTGKRRADPV
jgi:hypothetical protein